LQREVELVDRARASLAAGEPSGLFAALTEYERQFSNGTLAEEALYLRMQAHTLVREHVAVERAARELLRRFPSGAHAKRAQRVLTSGQDMIAPLDDSRGGRTDAK
jgi:outer membrane protein assembly factor BamD (BamD/ComL family)